MYSNKKDQKQLENLYSNLNENKKQLNEGISGVYPEEANNFGAMVLHILMFTLPLVLHAVKLSLDKGKLKTLKDKIAQVVGSDKSPKTLKDKIVEASKNVIFSEFSTNSTISKNLASKLETALNFFIPKNLESKTPVDVDNDMKRKEIGLSNPMFRGKL
jgi:hypothetical protein